MSDLTYSTEKLMELGSELVTIADVMDGKSPAVQYDAADVGHRSVHDALEHFSDNWDDRRELLTRSLRAVGGMALQSSEVFKEADAKLAAAVAKMLKGEK